MGLDHANHHVLAATLAADGFAEHGIGLANPGSVAEEQLENAALLLGCGFLQPLLWGFLHVPIIVRQPTEIVDSIQSWRAFDKRLRCWQGERHLAWHRKKAQ